MDKPSMKTEAMTDQPMTKMHSDSEDTLHAKDMESKTKPMHQAPMMHTDM